MHSRETMQMAMQEGIDQADNDDAYEPGWAAKRIEELEATIEELRLEKAALKMENLAMLKGVQLVKQMIKDSTEDGYDE